MKKDYHKMYCKMYLCTNTHLQKTPVKPVKMESLGSKKKFRFRQMSVVTVAGFCYRQSRF